MKKTLFEEIYEYFNRYFDLNNINWTNPYVYNNETGEEYEDPNRIEFYVGDYNGPYDSEFIFIYYFKDFFDVRKNPEMEGYERQYKEAPSMEVHEFFAYEMNSFFGDKSVWEKPFIKWAEDNFDLKIKTLYIGLS